MPISSKFDNYSKDEDIFETATAGTIKKVLTVQIEEEIQLQKLTKTAMAQRMHTSHAALNHLLDNKDTSLTLTTLASAATALGKQVNVELVSARLVSEQGAKTKRAPTFHTINLV
jgi:antitoxin HicB